MQAQSPEGAELPRRPQPGAEPETAGVAPTLVSDALWAKLEPILQRADAPARVGRRRVEQRRVVEAVLYRLATNCAWHDLPPSFPHPSSVYRSYRRWSRSGVIDELLAVVLDHLQSEPRRATPER